MSKMSEKNKLLQVHNDKLKTRNKELEKELSGKKKANTVLESENTKLRISLKSLLEEKGE